MSKLRKFRRTPVLFFADARSPYVRVGGSLLAKHLLSRPPVHALLIDPVDALLRAKIPIVTRALRAREAAASARRRALIQRHGQPQISVVMAAFNASETIADAIASVTDQSYASLELIIVNDASSDDTRAIAERLAARDSRIRVLSNDRQRGAGWSRNRGLVLAGGDYATFQDADDISHPQRLERQLAELIEHPSAVICLCNSRREDELGNVLVINGRRVSKAVIAMMFRREQVISALGYFTEYRVCQDAEFYERIVAVFGDEAEVFLFKTLYVQRFATSSLMFSDGQVTAGAGHTLEHARSAETEAEMERYRAHHQRIRGGRADPYVAFDQGEPAV